MSYEIIYDKQFIDLGEGQYIPIFYMGSNNCYQYVNGRERRERDWGNWRWPLKGKLHGTLEEMESNALAWKEKIKSDNEKRKRDDWYVEFYPKMWGYWTSLQIGAGHTTTTTFGMYLGLFRTGVKKALTVEQLCEEHIHVRVSQYAYSRHEFEEKYGTLPLDIYVASTHELKETIKRYMDHDVNITVSIDADEAVMRRLRKKYWPKKTKEKSKREYFFYVYAERYGVVKQLTARNLMFISSPENGRIFKTRREADVYLDKLTKRNFHVDLKVGKENKVVYI